MTVGLTGYFTIVQEIDRRFFGPRHTLWGAAAGLCLLFQGADFFRWSRLEYRELESFLRTENERSAFQGNAELEKAIQRMLAELKENLLLAHLSSLLERLGKFPVSWGESHLRNIQSALELQNLVFFSLLSKVWPELGTFFSGGGDVYFQGWPHGGMGRIGHWALHTPYF